MTSFQDLVDGTNSMMLLVTTNTINWQRLSASPFFDGLLASGVNQPLKLRKVLDHKMFASSQFLFKGKESKTNLPNLHGL